MRSRHIDGAADLGRMQRQQRFLAALIHKVTSSGVLMNPIRFKEVAATMLRSVRADRGFDANDMVDLGQAMSGFTPVVLGVHLGAAAQRHRDHGAGRRLHPELGPGEVAGGCSRPFATTSRSPRTRRRTRRRSRAPRSWTSPRPDPGAGLQRQRTARPGHAASKALHATGFATTGLPGNAVGAPVARTVIAYDPRWDRSARTLAAALPGAQLRPAANQGPVMKVTIGADYKAVHPVRAEETPQLPGGYTAVTGDQAVCP